MNNYVTALQVEGAEAFELRVNGAVVEGNGSVRSHPFMETDTGDDWVSWQYATVTITELGNGSSLTPFALSLVPITTTSGGEEITHGGFVDFHLLPVEIVPDYNRDGMINDEDFGKATDEKPFVFWINDDDDGNEEPHFGDVPGQGVDNADQVVNGLRDLVDFFPVQLRIEKLMEVLPPEEYTYRISHPTGALNFIEMPNVQPDSSPDGQGAGSYLRNQTMADDAMARPMNDTAGVGTELSIEYLDAVKNDMGVLLFESKSATNQSFELIVSKKSDSSEMARIPSEAWMNLVPVEDMFWRANIRPAANGQTPGAVVPPANAKFRDSRKDRWFVFCHGYNVNEEDARGWNAETFKRLHQKGSNARFLGISWEGNKGQLGGDLPFGTVFTPDYWRNAYNAFASSFALKSTVNGLPGNSKSKTVIAGHSMGNLIASSAICDHGLLADQYFLLNAAVAREAYSPGHITTDRYLVRHPTWSNYPTRLWSSDWFVLFPNDARKNLTWQGRFGSLTTKTTPHNYYSSTEDVLDNGTAAVPPIAGLLVKDAGAWIKQEMSKGSATKAFVTGFGGNNWTSHGGWAFNPNQYLNYRPDPLEPGGGNPDDTANITEAQLRANPFFKPFTRLKLVNGGAVPDSSNGIDLAGAGGAAHASDYSVRAWLLSHDVPAISNPTGKNSVFSTQAAPNQDTDIDSLKVGNWGAWKHSDMKNAPMDVVGKLYEKMVERGNLK